MKIKFNFPEVARDAVLLCGITHIAGTLEGSITPLTSLIVGATYSLVNQITKPFFQEKGILPIIFNTMVTTALVNYFVGYSLSLGKITRITFLPTILVLKIALVTAVVFFALAAGNQAFRNL
jgi:hypothetical protein